MGRSWIGVTCRHVGGRGRGRRADYDRDSRAARFGKRGPGER